MISAAHRALIHRPRQLMKSVLSACKVGGDGFVLSAADTWTLWLDAELNVRLNIASTWHITTAAATATAAAAAATAAAAGGVRAMVCGAAGGHAVAKVPIIRRYL